MELPLENTSPIKEDTSVRREEEDALGLTLVIGLNLKKMRGVDRLLEAEMRHSQRQENQDNVLK